MEINITHMVDDLHHMPCLSGSIMELGANAAEFTWSNSLSYAEDRPLLKTSLEIQFAKRYFETFGAWEHEDISAWSTEETNALLIQLIAGDIREMEGLTWEQYRRNAEAGQVTGRIFRDEVNGSLQYFYYVGE